MHPIPLSQLSSAIHPDKARTADGLFVPPLLAEPLSLHRDLVAVTTVNDRARIYCQKLLSRMHWTAGQQVCFALADYAITVRPATAPNSHFTIPARGYLRLPASLRHPAGIALGDRVLVAGLPDLGVLAVCPPGSLHHLLQPLINQLDGTA